MIKDKLNEIENDQEEITGINITPLVDVMLVLLIIFMVTASYIVSGSIKVVLPEVSSISEGESPKQNSAVFLLDKEGSIYFEGKIIQKEEVSDIIKDKNIGSVIISADRNALHGSVVSLMDIIKKAGISDFSVDVESKK